jgi:phosphoglycerate dehydrogenase-like enzyme
MVGTNNLAFKAILGLGEAGRAFTNYLESMGVTVSGWDQISLVIGCNDTLNSLFAEDSYSFA